MKPILTQNLTLSEYRGIWHSKNILKSFIGWPDKVTLKLFNDHIEIINLSKNQEVQNISFKSIQNVRFLKGGWVRIHTTDQNTFLNFNGQLFMFLFGISAGNMFRFNKQAKKLVDIINKQIEVWQKIQK